MPDRKKFDLDLVLSRLPQPAQHQGSLMEQMFELHKLAVHFGLYDADQWLAVNFFERINPTDKGKIH